MASKGGEASVAINAEPPASEERWAKTIRARSSRAHGRRTLVKLLDAAVAEFGAFGYHGARMARVARRAGTAHGTVYVYFEDKDDLLSAVYAEIGLEIGTALASMPVLQPGPAGFQAIRQWMGDVCDAFQRHGPVLQALTEALSDDDDSRAGREGLQNLARTIGHIADRIRATGTTGIDPGIAALCMSALIEGANRSVLRGELLVSIEELVTGLSEFVHRSVFGAS